MTDSQKLHTAARRYCINRYQHTDAGGKGLATESTVYSPYHVLLEAITLEVERFDYDALPDAAELREILALTAEIAVPFIGSAALEGETGQRAEREIRQNFARYVETFDFAVSIEPLPYRRVLFGDELRSVAKILRERWGATKIYFYPLDDANSAYAPTYFAYNDADFESAFPYEELAEILREHGVTRVYEIREWGEENYLQDVELMNPFYTGAEVFISSEAWDWLFYASHESSITTAGWLTQAVQDEWPEWEKAKYNPIWLQPPHKTLRHPR